MVDTYKQAQGIITLYVRLYQEKYGEKPVVNRNKLKYLLKDAMVDIGVKEMQKLVRYYLKVESNPSLLYFCYEYDELLTRMRQEAVDDEQRRILMRETSLRVEQFRERYGKNAE